MSALVKVVSKRTEAVEEVQAVHTLQSIFSGGSANASSSGLGSMVPALLLGIILGYAPGHSNLGNGMRNIGLNGHEGNFGSTVDLVPMFQQASNSAFI